MLAVGGGSAIDSAKAIAVGVKYEGDVWDFYTSDKKAKKFLQSRSYPHNTCCRKRVKQRFSNYKEEGQLKKVYVDENIRPVFAILDPELTFTLPKEQTLYGISDIFAHGLERYFTNAQNVDFQTGLIEGAFKSLIKNTYIVLDKPLDYAARAEIMWIGLLMHNGVFGMGRIEDWGSHMIEHEISAIYDIAHGAGLSIIFPAWMQYVYKHDINRFAQFAVRVFGAETYFGDEERTALEGIKRLKNF